jgi:hypothetical protein
MNNFQNLLYSNPDQYVGYGNPNADICFVGKEATGMLPLQCGLGSTNYWMTSLPMFFDRIKTDNPSDPLWKEGHTWNKYQKLYDAIFPENAAKHGTMNFEQHVFVTEMSAMPATTTIEGKNALGCEEQLALRKQIFFAHPYFKDFKVIVLACSDYIVNYGDRREIDSLFDVTFDINGGAHEIGPQNAFWVHHSADGKRMVIHTRQLSGAVSDRLLEEMGTVIRQHLNGYKGIFVNTPTTNKLSIGMSMNECRNIWGNPQDINKTTTPRGETEIWSYGNQKSLIFKNGVLKLINE